MVHEWGDDRVMTLRARIRIATDSALTVSCPACRALCGEVCTIGDAPLLWPCPIRFEAAEYWRNETNERKVS